jgi:putative redox protein
MTTVSASIGRDHYKTDIKTGQHHLIGDEPIADGGTDLGLAPYQFILSGLAACKVMTVRFYADRESWPLDRVEAELTMQVIREGIITSAQIVAKLSFEGNLTDAQKQKLLLIADKCPVHKLLMGNFAIESVLAASDERQ